MRTSGKVAASVVLGAAFGIVTAVVNWSATPADAGGGPLTGTVWEPVARVAGRIIDSGWAWAAMAVVAGRLVGALVWSMVAGAVTLLAATTGYDFGEAVLRIVDTVGDPALEGVGPSPWSWEDLVFWGIAAVILGPVLGAIGALTHRAGFIGLLASLAVPAGAALQMILLPPGMSSPEPMQRPENGWARAIVLIGALVAGGLLIARYVHGRLRAGEPEATDPGVR